MTLMIEKLATEYGSGCEITITIYLPIVDKCWLWLVNWLIFQATVAHTQLQLEVKPVLTNSQIGRCIFFPHIIL